MSFASHHHDWTLCRRWVRFPPQTNFDTYTSHYATGMGKKRKTELSAETGSSRHPCLFRYPGGGDSPPPPSPFALSDGEYENLVNGN